MTAKHTPTPWDKTDGYGVHNTLVVMVKGANYTVANCGINHGETEQANADFIIKACNHHDALVEALKDAVAALGGVKSDNVPQTVRKALAEVGA